MWSESLYSIIIWLSLSLIFNSYCYGQDIRINELVSSNITILDEDGDTPDWFELINTSRQVINLENWSLTDDFSEPDMWVLPATTLEPNEHLLIWASDKDRKIQSYARTLFAEGDSSRYIIPTGSTPNSWTANLFDDSDWPLGPLGIGYGDEDDKTIVPDGTPAVFIRIPFTIADTSQLLELILDIDFDDAYVAYINGQEISRDNISGPSPNVNTRPDTDREASFYSRGELSRVIIENVDGLIQAGENLLAISVHNVNSNSSDLSLIPFLSARFKQQSSAGIETPDFLNLPDGNFHSNFKLNNDGETVYLFDDAAILIDSLAYPTLRPNISYGLSPGEIKERVYFENTTPALKNSSEFFFGINEPTITFSKASGLTDTFSLVIGGAAPDQKIRYTINSTEPKSSSTEYVNPIKISSNRVIRAAIFSDDKLPSKSQTEFYIINKSHSLPIVSLVTEPENLYNGKTGIYASGADAESDFPYFGSNFWEDWERPAHFSFIEEDGSNSFSADVGIKIFGGWSRGHDQKSFSIFARKEYGTKEIKYPIFPEADYEKFEALVLRNSGNDWLNTNLRDGTLTSLLEGSGLDYQLYRPAVTYVNGQYWGIYNIREKINEHFLASKHGVNPDKVDILEKNASLIHGEDTDYKDLISFINNNDLANPSVYDIISEEIDLENFAMYNVAQIYFDNTDWPGNNIKFWKAKGGKWKWIIFDTDFGFGIWEPEKYLNNTLEFALDDNGPGWPNPPWSTFLFRNIMTNVDFQHLFINRFADELNTRFLPANVGAHISDIAREIRPEINSHFNRWNRNNRDWELRITQMRNFGQVRPKTVKDDILEVFKLPAYNKINIDNRSTEAGYVVINNRIKIVEKNWTGDYFEKVPITIKAIPAKGYIFSHWEGDSEATNASIGINPSRNKTFIPVFEKSIKGYSEIVINEINYNSSDDFDTGDWIELYNPNSYPVDISGWALSDDKEDEAYTFKLNASIDAEDYLIVSRDKNKFSKLIVENDLIGDFSFGLSSKEDAVKLFDSNKQLVDEVQYSSEDPWPQAANGEGWTLELISPELDNSIPTNWANVHANGSPGLTNMGTTSSIDIVQGFSVSISPNPFNGQINISIDSDQRHQLSASIYNITGKKVQDLFSEETVVGQKSFTYRTDQLTNGLYIIKLASTENTYSAKLIKL